MKSLAALTGGFLLAVSLVSSAQTAGTGAIVGIVSDPSGAVVSGATIKATNEATGESRTATSSGRGNYSVPLLPPGSYAVEITKAGFKTSNYRGITVTVTETGNLNARLEVGSISQSVDVTGAAEQLQTDTSSLGRVADSLVVESMPMVTRNYTQIIALSPGVAADVMNAGELGRGNGSNGEDEFVAAGGSNNDNNFQMNGVEINDFQQSGSFSGGVAVPNPDTIQEFKVQTGQYDASYGRDAGANVNVVTKTGTNKFHGSLFEFFRNDALNANEWFQKHNGLPRQVLRQNQYGMTFGGPIIPNKLLFFTSYQGTRQLNGIDTNCSTTFVTPPLTNDRSAAALGAIFSGQETFLQLLANDPTLGPSVASDGSNISPQALALMQMKLPNGQYLYPTPQTITNGIGSYSASSPCPYSEEQFMTNADWNQSTKDQWQGRFFFANSSQTESLHSTNVGGPTAPGFPYLTKQHFRNFSLTYNHTFTNNLLNQAEFGYHRQYSDDAQQEAFSYSQIGVTTYGVFDQLPAIYAAGLPTLGGNGQNVLIAQNTYVAQDTLAWQKGHHALRFGGGVIRPQNNLETFQYLAAMVFLTVPDFLLGQAANGLPLGNVYESLDAPLDASREWRVLDGNAYAVDDYKMTSRLTLNLGVRYERLGGVSDGLGRLANFNEQTASATPPAGGTLQGFVVSSNYSGPQLPAGVQKLGSKLAIAGNGQNTIDPRLGFAWRVPGTEKVVLRGGYGIFHQHITGQPTIQLLLNQPWGLLREQVTGQTATIADPFAFPGQPFNLPAFTPYSPSTQLSQFSFAWNFEPALIQRYNLNVQTAITRDMMLEVGYVGARGEHLMQSQYPNQALDATVSPIRGQSTNTVANLLERVPVQGFATSSWSQIGSEGTSWYNGLEASLTKQFSHGLQFLASYTWAKEISSDVAAATGVNGGATIGNQYDASARSGPDYFIRPQRFVVSFVYAPPFFQDRGALMRTALAGWKIAGVTQIQSGHQLYVEDTNASNLFGLAAPDADFAEVQPNCKVGTSGAIQKRIGGYFNSSCFPGTYPVISADGGTAFGNSRPGILRGPAQNNTDLSLIKTFLLRWPTEQAGVEFRAEMFNAFNHPQFSDPSLAVDSGFFGAITTTAVAPRIMQFALKLYF
ncbi:MAG: carboxypeptidase-like regulatory domain-containing protein [Candidatus Sulfotelmatobacter sp.]